MEEYVGSLKQIETDNLNRPKALAVLLCYNDGDILEEQIEYLLSQNHDIIAWDHGSDDITGKILHKYRKTLIEKKYIPRSFDFYSLYPAMSKHLIDNYIHKYDIISWPDQDEFLEGPSRKKTYYEYITEFNNSSYTYIQFDNYNFWYTKSDTKEGCLKERILHYSLFKNCAPRIRAWKAKVTNGRFFNHNPLQGERYPELFKLRHYPIRSEAHLMKRINKDRAELERNGMNYHYNSMNRNLEAILKIDSTMLHRENGGELNPHEKMNWDIVYR